MAKREKVVGEGPKDVIGQQDQVEPLRDDRGNLREAEGVNFDRRRAARVYHEERLHGWVRQLGQLRFRMLPATHIIRVHADLDQLVIVQVRDLDLGREDR